MTELLSQQAEESRDASRDHAGTSEMPRPMNAHTSAPTSIAMKLPSSLRAEESLPRPPSSLCSPMAEGLHADVALFRARGYALLPSVLRPEVHAYVADYYAKRAAESSSEFYRDEPSERDREHDSVLAKDRWALDNDALGLYLAERLVPLIESHTGERAMPGFVKVAWYTEGSRLPPHRDQVQNLWSISLVLSASAEGTPTDWPLQLIAAPTADDEPNHEVRVEPLSLSRRACSDSCLRAAVTNLV
jgi:hypothetical protein